MAELREEESAGEAPGSGNGAGPLTIHFPPFRLDAHNEQLWKGDQPVALRPKTFAVLRYLLERPQQLIRKQDLLERLWGDVSVSEAVLKTCFREIRRALGDSARTPCFIETAHRRGYRFIGRVGERERSNGTPAPAPPLPASLAPARSPLPPPETFVGREAELQRLDEAWRKARSGERQVVFVTGEPGIGKTSLVKSFLLRLGPEHALAVGQCVDQYGVGEPYLPLLEGLRRLARGPLRGELARTLRREAPSWLAHLPGLVESVDATGAAARGFAAAPERMLSEMADALEVFTLERPLLLWLEDLHWADHSTLACISYLARRSDPARLLVLGTYRPLAIRAGHPLDAVHPELLLQERCAEIKLGFLSQLELERYFGARFGQHHLPRELFRLVHVQTAGNPLFLDRVVDSWVTRGLVAQGHATWELRVGLEHVAADTPASIALMIEREMDGLDSFERHVLEAASVAGMEFSAASLAAALGEDLVRVEELCLRWARRRQFFHARGHTEWPDGTNATRCEFIHALYQQVAYERIGPAQRARLHARIGVREEAAYGARAREIASGLALHFERGQNRRKAVAYLAAAGEQALRRSACQEAIAHFQRGIELLQRLPDAPERRAQELELLVALGASLAMTRGHSAVEVELVYTQARALCQDQKPTLQLFQALMGIGTFHLVRGEYRMACTLGEQFLALAHQHPERDVTLEATLLCGLSRIFLGEFQQAERELEHTIALYRPEQHESYIFLFMQDPGVCAHSLIVLPLWVQGYPDRAKAHAEQALALAHEIDHPAAFVLAYVSLAEAGEFRGEAARVREHAEAGLALATQHGFEFYRATLSMLLGAALCEQGEQAAGTALIEQGWTVRQRTGSEFAGARWRSLLALALARAGRLDKAYQLLSEAVSRIHSHEERWWEAEIYRLFGELQTQTGAAARSDAPAGGEHAGLPGDPEACFLRALELSRQTQARSFELRAAISLARLWHARGNTQAARSLLEQSYGQFNEGFATADLERARQLLAELATPA